MKKFCDLEEICDDLKRDENETLAQIEGKNSDSISKNFSTHF